LSRLSIHSYMNPTEATLRNSKNQPNFKTVSRSSVFLKAWTSRIPPTCEPSFWRRLYIFKRSWSLVAPEPPFPVAAIRLLTETFPPSVNFLTRPMVFFQNSSSCLLFVFDGDRLCLCKILSLHKGGKLHVQITRHQKSREEKTAENSKGKEAGQTGKEEAEITGRDAVFLFGLAP